jgi:hypothetical protein
MMKPSFDQLSRWDECGAKVSPLRGLAAITLCFPTVSALGCHYFARVRGLEPLSQSAVSIFLSVRQDLRPVKVHEKH